MSMNITNPVVVGAATKKDHFDRVFDNTLAIYAGAIAIASQASLDFIYAASATQLARLAKGSAYQVPRMNAAGTGWEFADMGIKSLQRGTVTIASGQTSGTATITAIVTAKTMLSFLGWTVNVGGFSGGKNIPRIALTNTTTITATVVAAADGDIVVSFEAVEFY